MLYTPILVESESICVGASTSLLPAIVNNQKDVLSNNIHAMVGIYKEEWHWYFLIKFFFGLFQNLALGTS